MDDVEGPSEKESLRFLSLKGGRAGEGALQRVFQRIAKDAAEVIMVTEAELEPPGPQILWVNQAFTEVTGYGRHEVLGKTPRLLQGPKTDERELRRLRRALREERSFEGETTNYRKDGTTYINHWSIAPVYGDEGEVAYWVSVQRDVTETRRLQQEMVRFLDDERRRIGRDLEEAVGTRLQAAREELEDAAEQATLAPPVRDELRTARVSIDRGYERLRRISEGLSPVDLSNNRLTEGLKRLASVTPRCQFTTDVDPDDILSDLSAQAHTNLYWIAYEAVTNAERHAGAETIEIRLTCEDGDCLGNGVRLVVEDDGVGFDSDAAAADAWGLRLMTYRAGLIDGTIDVTSEPGAGTRVECHVVL